MRPNDAATAIASAFAQTSEEISRAVKRMRGVMLNGAADCDRMEEALRDLERLEGARITERLLGLADNQRRRIEALLVLLGDFNPNEPGALDEGMIAEAGLLFGDIAAAAELASNLLKQARQLQLAPETQSEIDRAAGAHQPPTSED
ncbi:hypothetical protein [Sinorhizobium fredii]|uniref:hypothetical protein n=1 Tax=Rhizobium fredii TaxID=380 RepID=UPI0005956100|nr:hypothetical protein [Sinorhizobium fredii]WOS63887.1 hypothetical protein SFGR64A_05750 [Sinorhizobium fredii GR64]